MYALGETVYVLDYDLDTDRIQVYKGEINSLPTSSKTPGKYNVRLNDEYEIDVYPYQVYRTVEDARRDIPDREKMLREIRVQRLATLENARSSPSRSRKSRKSRKFRKFRKSRRYSSKISR